MKSSLQIPHPSTTLHLYRHLLRESSYLPSVARPHIDRLIKFRVRRLKDDDDPKLHIKDGHHQLRALRAANGGDLMRMQRVLSYAFGRRGKRRRELWDDFMYPIPPAEIKTRLFHPKRPKDIAPVERKADFLDRWDRDKLWAFLKSQVANQTATQDKSFHLHPPEKYIPKESAWGLPLVPELARNMLKRRLVILAKRIMPPIPKKEWEILRDIVENKASKEVFYVPKRRPVARNPDTEKAREDGWNWAPYAIKPIHTLESQANRKNRLLSGAVDEHTPTGQPLVIGCHKFTPRLWRRLFTSIWQQTAYIEKAPDAEKWNIVWGKFPRRADTSSKHLLGFFADAEGKGMVPKVRASGEVVKSRSRRRRQ